MIYFVNNRKYEFEISDKIAKAIDLYREDKDFEAFTLMGEACKNYNDSQLELLIPLTLFALYIENEESEFLDEMMEFIEIIVISQPKHPLITYFFEDLNDVYHGVDGALSNFIYKSAHFIAHCWGIKFAYSRLVDILIEKLESVKEAAKVDIKQLIEYARKAEDELASSCAYTLAGRLFDEGLFADAYHFFGTIDSFPVVKIFIGHMLEQGLGVDKDEVKAFNTYLAAAECDYTPAMLALIRCYKLGIGTAVDLSKISQLQARVDAEKDAFVMMYIGVFYSDGIAIEKDVSQAKAWYIKAIDAGNTRALALLAHLELQG